jgi:NADPH-dependent 2,4-dienoyl-CoA reductase/sulfur reductase-like enzyme
MRVVIIGNGVAGIEAALLVRDREPSWEVTVVSEESDHFFSRTALMWVHSGQLSQRCIEPYERGLYDRLGIRRVRARATGVDVERHRLHLAGGLDPLDYDRLLIACGSRPRPGPWPGSDLQGVGHFVTMQDLAWYEQEIYGAGKDHPPPRPDAHLAYSTPDSPYRPRTPAAAARGARSRHPVVIGGGLIGIEAVEVAVAAGLKPRFFIREDWFWPLILDERESRWIGNRMGEHGVEVQTNHEVDRLEGEPGSSPGRVAQVVTNRGTFPADCVVIAIGVIPNTAWLDGSPIEQHERGGVLVDDALRTSAPDVFAAGDCAVVTWFDGSRRPEQLWYTARDQGRVAARSLLGDDVRYDRGTWYNSAKLMDIEWTQAGLVNMKLDGEESWFFEETGRVRSTTRIIHQKGRVVGFNLLGRRWDHSVLCRFIEEHRSLEWTIAHLREASFDTEFVPPLVVPETARPRPAA